MTPDYRAAIGDLRDGLRNYPLWVRLGISDSRRRYRRTRLGPLWMTISLGIFILAAGVVWTHLWQKDPREFIPYLTSGMIAWVMLTSMIREGCNCFIAAEQLITQLRFPYTMLTLALVWRNFIGFMHNLLIFVVVAIFAGLKPTVYTLAIVPALALLFINGVWVATLLGVLCTRFRDLQQLITSILQVAIFITPIFWLPTRMPINLRPIVDLNILYHFVQLIRAPLLGIPAQPVNWYVGIGVAIVGWAFTLWFYARFRRRLAYWL